MDLPALGLAVLMGVVAGSRTMMAPAAVSWAAFLGILDARSGWLLVFGHPWARWIWSALAAGELVTDQLPFTAVVGTFGGSALRGRMAAAFGNDHPAALVEDALALGLAVLVVVALR